jgi:DNA oxidative demethylase
MPAAFAELGRSAAARCGFDGFAPDACLVNRYVAGAGMGMHQDRDEQDFSQPIVSVSLGAPCKFIIGGLRRNDPTRSFTLNDGDVLVWGGAARLVFHGVRPLPVDSAVRHNITLAHDQTVHP